MYPYDDKRIIELDKERGFRSLTRKEVKKKMVGRRFTTEDAWEKIDDVQDVIVDLLGRYDGFSQKDISHLEKAWNELRQVMCALDPKFSNEKR